MKKKVLIVMHHLTYGGIQKSCMDVLRAIDYDKYDVTLYVRKNRMAMAGQIAPHVRVVVNQDSTRYYRKPLSVWYQVQEMLFTTLRRTDSVCRVQKRLAAYINEEQIRFERNRYFQQKYFDVAVAYSGGYEAVLTAQIVNAGKKYVFFHGSEDEYRDIYEMVLPTFDGLIAVNNSVAELVRQWYPELRQRVSAIENYVDADAVRKKATAFSLDRRNHKLVLCSCGRYAPVKGFDIAVETAAILNKKQMDFLWYFVGDGPERDELEQKIAEYGLAERIHLTGMQENPYPYMELCDIYVQPSRAESHSLTLVEAQILGKPCVSTKTVGGQQLVQEGKCGLLADISPESIASCILELADNPVLRNRMSEYLRCIDYEAKRKEYQNKWNALLAQED